MTPFLHGFTAELVKLSASVKDPTAGAQAKMRNLLKGGLEKYVGKQDVRNATFPSMGEVANRAFKDQAPKLDARAPKSPKV